MLMGKTQSDHFEKDIQSITAGITAATADPYSGISGVSGLGCGAVSQRPKNVSLSPSRHTNKTPKLKVLENDGKI